MENRAFLIVHTPITQSEPCEGNPVFVHIREMDGRYFADIDMLMEPNLPHHGEGATHDEAIDSLYMALKASWKCLSSAKKLSRHMEKRKRRLDDLAA